jgi:hypothetical protein
MFDKSKLAAILREEGLIRQAGVRTKGMVKQDGQWMLLTNQTGPANLNAILRGLGGAPINNDIGTFWVFSRGYVYDDMSDASDAWEDANPEAAGSWWDGPEQEWVQANQDFMGGAFGKYFPSEATAIANARKYKRELYVGKVKVHMKDIKPSGKTTRQLMFLPKKGQYAKPVPGILASKRLIRVG